MNPARRLRAVIDTNVLLDLWVFEDLRAAPLRDAIEGARIEPLRSASSDDEFGEVLGRPGFAMSEERRCLLLQRWQQLATAVEPIHRAPLSCSDRDDQKFLDLACCARADWLITRDKALLREARRARALGLDIMEPVQACVLLETLPA